MLLWQWDGLGGVVPLNYVQAGAAAQCYSVRLQQKTFSAMYIKFCRSYDRDKKDEARVNLSPGSKLSVELEGEKGRSEHFLFMCLSFTDLTIVWLFLSLEKQANGKTRLYQALCMFLTVLCLILLVVIIVLSTRGAYLQPSSGFLLKTNHCCHGYVCNTKISRGRFGVF